MKKPSRSKYKIFISYPRGFYNFDAAKIQEDAEKCGARAFLDSLIPFGKDFEKEILDNIMDCDALWVMITPPIADMRILEPALASMDRPYIKLETGVAWCRGICIIPLLNGVSQKEFAGDERIPLVIRAKRAVDWANKEEYQQLLHSVREKVRAARNNHRHTKRIAINPAIHIVYKYRGKRTAASIAEISEDGQGCFINTDEKLAVRGILKSSLRAKIMHNHARVIGGRKLKGLGVEVC